MIHIRFEKRNNVEPVRFAVLNIALARSSLPFSSPDWSGITVLLSFALTALHFIENAKVNNSSLHQNDLYKHLTHCTYVHQDKAMSDQLISSNSTQILTNSPDAIPSITRNTAAASKRPQIQQQHFTIPPFEEVSLWPHILSQQMPIIRISTALNKREATEPHADISHERDRGARYRWTSILLAKNTHATLCSRLNY